MKKNSQSQSFVENQKFTNSLSIETENKQQKNLNDLKINRNRKVKNTQNEVKMLAKKN